MERMQHDRQERAEPLAVKEEPAETLSGSRG
jgi:hypothetical protein